jgi:hypothetical protein
MRMNNISFTFGDKIAFLFEKRIKTYDWYGDVSIAEEKVIIAQKILQCGQLCCSAGRIGV